jgi:hypothetical protein
MGNITIYFSKADEQELRATAAIRGVGLQDILRERLKLGRDMEEVARLRQAVEKLAVRLQEQEDRLGNQIGIQADWANTISGLMLAKTCFLEELFILINKENDQEYRTQESSEAAAKFIESLRR